MATLAADNRVHGLILIFHYQCYHLNWRTMMLLWTHHDVKLGSLIILYSCLEIYVYCIRQFAGHIQHQKERETSNMAHIEKDFGFATRFLPFSLCFFSTSDIVVYYVAPNLRSHIFQLKLQVRDVFVFCCCWHEVLKWYNKMDMAEGNIHIALVFSCAFFRFLWSKIWKLLVYVGHSRKWGTWHMGGSSFWSV